jgi:hypothetical protein
VFTARYGLMHYIKEITFLLLKVNSVLCRRCGAEKETSAHVVSAKLSLHSDVPVYLGSFFLDPGDVWV